jgi:dethiobiotin synthetase
MDSGVFITGTDTDIGKTVITTGLISALRARGYDIGGMKPVQSGAIKQDGQLLAPDIEFLLNYTDLADAYDLLNPIRLEPALAPSVAAKLAEKEVDINQIMTAYQNLQTNYQGLIVEGAGGLMVPLTDDFLIPDLVKSLDLPVIVVARPDLGTINHTVLTVKAAQNLGLEVLGVIINGYQAAEAGVAEKTNPDLIAQLAEVPILGVVPYVEELTDSNKSIDLGAVLEEHVDLEVISDSVSVLS